MTNGPFDLSKTPLHLGSIQAHENPVIALHDFGFNGPAFESYIKTHCTDGPGRIMMVETSPVNWPIWERHTLGDEIVIVFSGSGEFIQEIEGNHQRIKVEQGQAIVNPSGVWHTADITEAITALYITPADGTEHRER